MSKFLKKEADKGGAMHKIKFKGSAEDLATLVTWLASLTGTQTDTMKADSSGGQSK